MPSQVAVIGTRYDVYVPNPDELIALGYTHIRVFQEANESDAVGAADTSIALVSGTYDYSYNKTDGLETDWAEHCFFGATPGEGPHTDRVPIALPRTTRLVIRQGVGRRLRRMETATVASAASNVKFIASRLIDPDASAARYANWFARPSTGVLAGETRRVRNLANTGYAPTTGEITVGRSYGDSLAAGVIVELWKPTGDEDTSALVDEAINNARIYVWQEIPFIFTMDSNVTEYSLPDGCNEKTIRGVEWMAGSYPDRPMWLPTDSHRVNGRIITLYRTRYAEFSAGDFVRVTYATPCDILDSDSDYWSVNKQWAIAESAMAFLDLIPKPGGQDEAIAHEREKAKLQRELMVLRSIHLPIARIEELSPR